MVDHRKETSTIPRKMEKPGTNETERISSITEHTAILKLDKHGLPLVPQPSDHKDDPLNWPTAQKYYIVLLMSSFSLMAQLSAAMLNPAFVQVAKDLHVTVEEASYTTTVYILFTGIFPLFIVPFANVYGRRNLYLIFTVIAIAGCIGAAAAPTWGGVMAGRIFAGIGSSVSLLFHFMNDRHHQFFASRAIVWNGQKPQHVENRQFSVRVEYFKTSKLS